MASDLVTFQLLSDLHLEFPTPTAPTSYSTYLIPPKAPYLTLAGDIGLYTHLPALREFLSHHVKHYKQIFFIPGNHEYYHQKSHAEGRELGKTLEEGWEGEDAGKVRVLDQGRVDLEGGVTVLGCTLHSFVPEEKKLHFWRMNDFNIIGKWDIETYNKAHLEDVAWLKGELAKVKGEKGERQRVVIITHHAPTFEKTSPPEYRGSDIGSGFATELLNGGAASGEKPFEEWEGNELVKVWCFGHTHFCTDWKWKDRVRVLANQRGYVIKGKEERAGFDIDFTFGV